jgi:hypothetical protein
MRITRSLDLVNRPSPHLIGHLTQALAEVDSAIRAVDWPVGSGSFTINPAKHANGVVPIKLSFVAHLEHCGWEPEKRDLRISTAERKPGPLDAVKTMPDRTYIAAEWETGNISSSHRALNKMVLGMQKGILAAGVLVLPSRRLYAYLTDRVGNFQELEPYFGLWCSVRIDAGWLRVIEIEHDRESTAVASIGKGTDGRALR